MEFTDNKDLLENNENQTPETEETKVVEDVVTENTETNTDSMSVVSAKDSALDQTVSAVSSDSAIFDINVKDFNVEIERRKQKVGNVFKNIFVYAFLTLCAVLAFLPFYWMVISSLKTEMEYRQSVPSFFPHTFMWINYKAVLSQTSANGSGSFAQVLINTLVVGFFSTAIGVLVTIVTAYALARMNFKGKNLLFSLMLATMMIPGEMYTITNYLTVSAWGWKDTFTVLILPFLVSVYYTYLLRNNFMQIPDSLYKAAKVDGLSDMGYLVKVMVPLPAPTLVSITLLKFIGTWNSYIWPRLVNSKDWQLVTNWVTRGFTDRVGTVSGAIYGLPGFGSETLTTLKMAAVCMGSLPLFILFITCRKYIMHGVSKSGTKG